MSKGSCFNDLYTFGNRTAGGAMMSAKKFAVKNWIISNKEWAKDLHKPIFENLKKRKVKSLFIDSIWGADLADMQLLSKFNNGVRLLCITDIFSKYAWVIPLKDKKGISITNAFQKLFDESYRKPNKIRVLWMIHRLCVM